MGSLKTITTQELPLKISDLVKRVCYKFEVIAKNKGGESLADKRLIETNFSEGIKTETVYSVLGDSLTEGEDTCRNI